MIHIAVNKIKTIHYVMHNFVFIFCFISIGYAFFAYVLMNLSVCNCIVHSILLLSTKVGAKRIKIEYCCREMIAVYKIGS